MVNVLNTLLAIALFRAKPQDLPSSNQLLVVTTFLAILTYALTDTLHDQIGLIMATAIAQVVLFGAAIYFALRIKNVAERWPQTITALYGCGAILQLLGWPLSIWLGYIVDPAQRSMPFLLIVALGFWFLAIMTWVLHHALDTPKPISFLISMTCQGVVVIGLLTLLGPDPFNIQG